MTIMMMAIATIPYISVLFDAKPVGEVTVGAKVAGGELAWNPTDAEDA